MKENKKAILEILKKKSKKDGKFENLVLNLALQKIDSDSFEFDGEAVYTNDKTRLVYCMSQDASFTIPEGTEVIGEMAFRGKKSLKNIIIANSVKEIEHDAFYDCDELDNVYVPAGVKTIKGYAFAECDKLKKITFAGVPKQLSRHTFDDCDLLHEIIVPAETGKTFRKELHYIDGDAEYIITELPAKKNEVKEDKKEAKAEKKEVKVETKEVKVETKEVKVEKKETKAEAKEVKAEKKEAKADKKEAKK